MKTRNSLAASDLSLGIHVTTSLSLAHSQNYVNHCDLSLMSNPLIEELKKELAQFHHAAVREAIGTKTIDLRDDGGDGTPGKDKVGMSEKQLGGARKFISEMCAAKAMNRAIADVLAIRRSYTPQDLVKPFIVPKLVPDTSNELAQRAVLANMFGATQAMFAPPATVVDAHFEDVATATPAASDEAAGEVRGGSLPSPAADTSIPHDPRTGEVRGSESIDARMSAAWGLFERAGGARDDFRGLVQAATGKSRKSDLTLDDAELVERAVDAAVANMDNSGDDVAY